VKIVAEPLPPEDLVDRETRIPVGKGQEEVPAGKGERKNHESRNPRRHHALAGEPLASSQVTLGGNGLLAGLDSLVSGLVLGGIGTKDELDERSGYEGGGKMGGEIMMQEELATHHVEGEVMGGPGEEEEACGVVQTGARTCQEGLVSVIG